MASYNTSGVTSYDPRNLGGSEGYGPSKPASKGLASKPKASKMDSDMYAGSNYAPTSGAGTSKAKQTYAYNAAATANDDNVSYGQSYSPMALSAAFTSAGATLPPPAASKTMTFRDYTGGSLYDSDIFKPNILPDNSSDINNFLGRAAIDDALREALGPPESPEIYLGQQTPSEPDSIVDMSVLQGALQPEPITVEEIEVKAGDTLTTIAKDNDVSLSDLIDANPQIGNPDLIRPGEKVALPDPRFEGVPKPRGVADSPRLSEGVADPRKIGGGIDGIEAPVAEVADMGVDPRNLGGAEGYGSVGTPPEADTGEGLMTRPKARPTGLDAPDEKERIKAVQTIIGTKADGAFGKGSKAKLKAWQYVHGVPTTGELDEVTMEALKDPNTYDPREITRDNFIQTPTFDLLKGVEGFEEEAYLGLIDAGHKSGLTVGAGLDFGQHTRQALLDKGLPQAMVDKAADAGWIGLNPDTIIDPLTGNPVSQGSGTKAERRARGETLLKAKLSEQKTAGTFPEFTFEELAESAPIMYKPYEDAAKRDYDRVEGAGSFDALKTGTKAALATEKYHRGESADISYMFNGARADNPALAAEGIGGANPSTVAKRRRKNMKAWLRKVGLNA